MNHDQEPRTQYPHGRGYGHDYMRGGEVLGGYGYSEREEYARRRGEAETARVTPTSTDGERTTPASDDANRARPARDGAAAAEHR